jgi:hypothetical protein
MPNELVVAITLGQHDLQFLAIDTHGKKLRISPVKEKVGVIHRALIAKEIPYVVWCPQETGAGIEELRAASVDWDGGQLAVNLPYDRAKSSATSIYRLATPKDVRLGTQDAGENWIVILPGVLHLHLATLRSELLSGQYQLRRVLLFDTNRGEKWKDANSEPVAAAPILAQWLRQTWLTEVPDFDPDVIEPVTYLREVRGEPERLYVQDNTRNRYLNPIAAARIDSAFRKATTPKAIPRLHDSAGIPEVRPVLHASIRLRLFQLPQIRPTDQHPNRELPAFDPIDPPAYLLETRRRVRDLVLNGQFAAAEGTVSQLVSHPQWRTAVESVAHYIRGYQDNAATDANRIGGELAQLLRRLTDNVSFPRCVHIAIRAEAALWADDIVLAVNLTSTFFDVALLDAVDLVLPKDREVGCVDWDTGDIRVNDLKIEESDLFATLQEMQKTWPYRFAARKPNSGQTNAWKEYVKSGTFWTSSGWQEAVLIEAIRKQDASIGEQVSLTFRALQEKPQIRGSNSGRQGRRQSHHRHELSPAQLRNRFTHVVPTQSQLEKACEIFRDAELWRPDELQFGQRFTASPRLAPLLKCLNVDPPETVYAQLVRQLCEEIENA